MVNFQKVYEKLSQGFDGVPCDELGISDEVKEQVGPFRFSYIFALAMFVFFSCFFNFLEEWF